MFRAVESGEAVGAFHPAWCDSIAVTGLYLVHGDRWILITNNRNPTTVDHRGQLSAWLIDTRSLLSIIALSQLAFPWVASHSWMLRARKRKAGFQRAKFNQSSLSKSPGFPWKSQLSTLPAGV